MRLFVRLLVVFVAYAAGVLGLFASFAILFGLASLTPFAPGYWTVTAVSPIIFVNAPLLGLFVVLSAIVLSIVPMVLVVVLTEVFKWRSPNVYAIPGAVLGAAIYLMFSPRTIGGLDQIGMFETFLFALSGACAGMIYWAIAGRRAGSWRRDVPVERD